MAPRVQIVAYGNPLRGDDGVAWRAADALAGRFSPEEVEVVTMHQLGPELAESIRHSECVIFIDAAVGPGPPGEIRIKEVSEISDPPQFCHALSPAHVVALAERLYNSRPRSFSATVVGENFGHGESLSEPVKAAIPVLVARIDELAGRSINQEAHNVTRRNDQILPS